MRRLWKWTKKQEAKLERVLSTLEELKGYWPLTLRQVYYQLVARQVIANKVTEYAMLSKLLKHARLDGLVLWEAIEDRLRTSTLNRGWRDKNAFLDGELYNFLNGYRRHLQQGQGNYIEFWIEKDALRSIFQKVANPFCIPVCVCRGFSSVSFLHELSDRLADALSENKQPVILYFGDFDPSGEEMLPAMQTTLEDEMDVQEVQYEKVALTREDVDKYNLPHDPNAVKKSDSRYLKFVAEHGLYAVELDALPPDVLEQRIRQAIENNIDSAQFQRQVAIAAKEDSDISSFKAKVESWIRQEWNQEENDR